jgi:hypothetical protein
VTKFTRFISLYRHHFRDHRRERMFLASCAFFLTFGVARAMVYVARVRENDFRLLIGGVHVHHLVWGILLLLVVGYLWLIQADHPGEGDASRLGRWTAFLYGAGAALTLDEFALWLHLDDVYFDPAGRLSVDTTILFGALVSAGLWGGPFLRASARQVSRMLRRPPKPTRRPALEEPNPGREMPLVGPIEKHAGGSAAP